MEVNKVKSYLKTPKRIRVAAYARVSSGKDSMLHSLAAQTSYYNSLIQGNKAWVFVEVFCDEAISGTKDERAGFNTMMQSCKDGKIDMIITKSISRFARNTVTLIKACRDLKEIGVDVYFEEQNLHSTSSDGELMLTLLASHAQEEARSVSENVKWRARSNFEQGLFYSITVLGYRVKKGLLYIVPEEAEIVKEIFSLYLSGYGAAKIAMHLNKKGSKTRFDRNFTARSITQILKNEVYTGKAVLQKTYITDFISKRWKYNNGELARYIVEDSHEPIVDKDTFMKAQEEIAKRQIKYPQKERTNFSPFCGRLKCSHCGAHHVRKKTPYAVKWTCSTYDKYSAAGCSSQAVPESELIRLTNEVLNTEEFDERLVKERIEKILVSDNHLLTFFTRSGEQIDKYWIPKRKEVKIYAPSYDNRGNAKPNNKESV